MLYCMFSAFERFEFRISNSLECIYHLHLGCPDSGCDYQNFPFIFQL